MITKKIQLSENAQKVAQSRYFMDGEDWEKCTERVADTAASPEGDRKVKYKDLFQEMIYDLDFLPGGRILRNSQRSRGSLFNCYHLPIGDSIQEIGDFYRDALILWSEGGGVGCNFTPLRPKDDPIMGKGGKSSGLVSWIEGANAIAQLIESGGSRRAAAIAHVDISHPEILRFIDSKTVHGRLSHFNISVSVSDNFLESVEKDDLWEFKFKQKSYGKIKARVLWDKIVQNMIEHAEPGLLNWNNFQKNNSFYFEPVLGTNPCGETTLGPYGVCDLGSLVLPNFITGNVNTNWKKLETVIKLAIRFLDNIIDVNKYTLQQIDTNAHNSRRIGLGIMGIAEYLFAKKVRYGSDKAISELDKLMRFIRDSAYQASVELAIEKGSFPKFDAVQFGKASFIRKLPAPLRMDIKKFGIRNTTLMALAPTGTISLIADYTNGIEPLYSKAYMRHDRVSDRIYIHPKYEELLKSGEPTPDWYVDSFDLEAKDHFEVQVIMQKYTDGSVSKTINLPKETTSVDLSKLLLEYIHDLKGVTVYRDGTRDGQILNKMEEDTVKQYLTQQNIVIERHMEEHDVECATGSCEI
jgi:ribonucleoside-diphosphate reductase alpha chain